MSDPGFEALLEYLKTSRGFDFTGYKRASLERRFRRRMEVVGCEDFTSYQDFLEVHAEEFEQLFDALLINVTSFFRDPPAWDVLRTDVLPAILERRGDADPIRVWSAGCASGQEAYSIAMALAELLGPEAYRGRVKVYGTDVDEDALAHARMATYTAKEVESVPEALLERYFERADRQYVFRSDLRRTVIFGRNNLLQDAPISRLDLLLCRNTLMYFTAESQARILRQFHFALGEDGTLMLGRSEMMLSHRDAFHAIDLKQRIFRRDNAATTLRGRIAMLTAEEKAEARSSDDERLSRDAALDLGPHAQIVVSRSGLLTFANLTARTLFSLSVEDLGEPFSDLAISYQPTELRGPVEQALRERRRVVVGEVPYTPETGEPRRLEITVSPLVSDGEPALGALVRFEDVTRYATLVRELEGNRRDLELAYEELQSTIDELETTNEELESANEELQTTNEELQSTNEELETINDELRERTGELHEVNDFLETILTSLELGVAVIDPAQRIQIWNQRAEDLWGLRRDEALGQYLLALDIGLPTEQLAPALRGALNGSGRQDMELAAVNRRGRPIVCVVTVLPRLTGETATGDVRGAIVLMGSRPDGNGEG